MAPEQRAKLDYALFRVLLMVCQDWENPVPDFPKRADKAFVSLKCYLFYQASAEEQEEVGFDPVTQRFFWELDDEQPEQDGASDD